MKDRITLITGGSRGIGRATALYLAGKGHKICIGYHTRKDSAQDVVGIIRHGGGKAIAVPADISEDDQVVELFRQIDKDLGSVSGLVNNAGILKPQASIEQLDSRRYLPLMWEEASSVHARPSNVWLCSMADREERLLTSHLRHPG